MTTELDDRSVGRNIGRLATTRHVDTGRASETAIRWFGRDDACAEHPIDITYEMLEHRTNRFAGGLRRHGIEAGDGVATITGRIPELYVAALGTLKAGCVYMPIPPELASGQIAQRLAIGGIRVVVTTPAIFRNSVAEILEQLPDIGVVVVVGATEDSLSHVMAPRSGSRLAVISFGLFISEGHDVFDPWPTPQGAPALLHFADGAPGAPLGLVLAHDEVIADLAAADSVLDLHHEVYWCVTDGGDIVDSTLGAIAPLVGGAVSVVDEAGFDADRWNRITGSHSVELFSWTSGDAPPAARCPVSDVVGSSRTNGPTVEPLIGHFS